MPNKVSRRDFLRLGALAAAGAVVSGCTVNLQKTEYLESYVKPPEEGLPGENLWYATTCRQCPAGCGMIVRVSNGRARKAEGNPLHPVNQGKLCARGQAVLQELYDPDRLQNAVQQAGRGTQQFTPLRWEDALATLTERLQSVPPESVAFLGGNMSSHLAYVAGTFLTALGNASPRLVPYTLGEELEGRSSLSQASEALFGVAALPLFDIAHADVVFSFGANFLETWLSPVHYSRTYAQMRKGALGKRGYLVQFEPRMSSTAASADEWVSLRPGSEGLVALGLIRILSERGWRRGGGSFDMPYEQVNLDEVTAVSGIALEQLERLAGLLVAAPRALALPGGALGGQTNGPAALQAILLLNLVLGQLGQPGGVYLPPAGQFDAPAPFGGGVDALIRDMAAGQIQMLFLHGTNPLYELPPAAGFAAALEHVPLVVSFSSIVDETAIQSDLILPDHTNLESWGYYLSPLADRTVVGGMQPIMPALYDTRSTVDVFLALAQALGGVVAQDLPWANEVDYLKEALAPYQDPALSAEAFWSAFRRQGGWWAAEEEVRTPVASAPSAPLVMDSATFVGEEAEYPFYLHLFPSITLGDGRGANKSWLQETPDPMTTVAWQTWVELHPETARELGVGDDDVVRIVSPAGEIEAVVYVTPGIHPQVVAIAAGHGHEAGGRYATWGYGGNPVQLLANQVVAESGALAWAAVRVRLERTGRRRPLARLENPAGIAFLRQEH
jgi:anaerobic selenocysteine-containing dehydrogenase